MVPARLCQHAAKCAPRGIGACGGKEVALGLQHAFEMTNAKGAGEAGTAGAPAAVMNAINDAIAPFGAVVHSQPITPEKLLRALLLQAFYGIRSERQLMEQLD